MDGCHIIIHRSEDILTWTQKKEIFFFYMNKFEDETWKLKNIFLLLCTKPDIITPWMGVNYNKKTLSFKFQSLQGHPVGWIRPFDWLDPWTTISVPMSNCLDSGCHNLNILIKKTNLFRHVRLDNPKQNYADITFLWILSHQNTKNKEALQ